MQFRALTRNVGPLPMPFMNSCTAASSERELKLEKMLHADAGHALLQVTVANCHPTRESKPSRGGLLEGSGLAASASLRGLQRVDQQHGDRHGSDAARHRRDIAGDLAHR